ncbi:N-acetylmuramoyl-L-alanine amidase [Georgenia sp. M64]|uniref:N-acetylmuramoyl-L-alanine amidase n=1 Tax=Georgenia sp. M64 TaxID=3120520 RepID=UPI0030DE6AEE
MAFRRPTALSVAALLVGGALVVPAAGAAQPASASPSGLGAAPAATTAPEPVTVISLTDAAGDLTPVAAQGVAELEDATGTSSDDATIGTAGLSAAGAGPEAAAVPAVLPADTAADPADIAVLTPPVDTEEFLVAGLTWDAGAALPSGARVFLRVLEDGVWSDWLETQVEEGAVRTGSSAEGRAGTDPFVTGGAEAVQVQVSGDAAELPAGLELSLMPANPAPPTEVITDSPAEPEVLPTEEPTATTEPAAFRSLGTTAVTVATAAGAVTGGSAPTVAATTAAVTTPAVSGAVAPTAVPAPAVVSRAGWGADESLMTWQPKYSELKAAVVHHTAGTNTYTSGQSASIVRGIYYYHAVTRDWGDIGYNFLVDKYGQVFEGRRGSLAATNGQMTIGAHAAPANTNTLGIAAMGDYTVVDAPQVVLDKMADVIAWKFGPAGIDMSTPSGIISPGTYALPAGKNLPRVFGHRDVSSTACPGNDIYGRIAGLSDQVARLIAASSAPVPEPEPEPAPAPPSTGNPYGMVDGVSVVRGGVRIEGWAIDPDTTSPIYVWVTVDGQGRHLYANDPRPDVDRAYGAGPDHGYTGTFDAGPGAHVVCATASNVGAGTHQPLGCRTVVVEGDPYGNLESVTPTLGGIEVKGWAIDPDTTGPAYVWLTVDGQGRHLYANQVRGDVGRTYPAYGDRHGFRSTVFAAPGEHVVCATASNVGTGEHRPLGCRTVTVTGGPPFGNFERATGVDGGIALSGWAIDPDTTSPVYVWVTVDGRGRHLYASGERGDVARVYPHLGSRHGFSATLAADSGRHRVCVTGSNVGEGSHKPFVCRDVTVP